MRSNEKFTQRAELAIERARRAAGELGHRRVGTEHLLLGILQEREGLGARILGRRGLEEEALRRAILRRNGSGTPGLPREELSAHARQAVERSAAEAGDLRQGYIGTEHLLLGILRQPDCGGVRLLEEQGLRVNDVYTDILAVFGSPASGGRAQTGFARSLPRRSDTRVLDQYSRDLTELAAAGRIDPVVGRGEEIRRAVQILARRTKNLAWAKQPWPKALRCRWPGALPRRSWHRSASSRWISPRCWPEPSTAEISRSGSRRF